MKQYKKDIKNLSDFRKILGVCKSLRYSFNRLKKLLVLEKNTLSILQKFSLALDDARSSYVEKIDLRKINAKILSALRVKQALKLKKNYILKIYQYLKI